MSGNVIAGALTDKYNYNSIYVIFKYNNKVTNGLIAMIDTKTLSFITKSNIKHNNRYSYDNVKYIDRWSKVKINCKLHGEFLQSPALHLRGNGCKQCSSMSDTKTNDFIQQSKQKHGLLYNYDATVFTNWNTKVSITCLDHGPFLQNPKSHTNGAICPTCMGRVVDTKSFITKAKNVHDDKYSYIDVVYETNKTNVNIICHTHGRFVQTPDKHINSKTGCPKCAGNYKKDTQTFIHESQQVHNHKYKYEKVDYVNIHTKVMITCKKHGDFLQDPASHLQGTQCPGCANTILGFDNTQSGFMLAASTIHHNAYDYNLINYTNTQTKVIIQCSTHGPFAITPSQHLYKQQGCPECSYQIRALSRYQFINKANLVHHNKYNYNTTNYTRSNVPVVITCPSHGDFTQLPYNHIYGKHGCPSCMYSCGGVSSLSVDWIKLINQEHSIDMQHHENGGEFYIPGARWRVDGYDPNSNTVYEFYGDFWHGNPKIFCGDDINPRTSSTYRELYDRTVHRENEIKQLGYKVFVVWESEFKNGQLGQYV